MIQAPQADIIGGFPVAEPDCAGCGKPLQIENAWMTDGCPCNSPLGVNSMNETRWRLLMQLMQFHASRGEKLACGHSATLLVKSVESDYQFCQLCESQDRLRDALTMEREHGDEVKRLRESLPLRAPLFVIRQRGRDLYWQCNNDHGAGWSDTPKQSFTKSQLAKELFSMIDHGHFTDCEIVQLLVPKL